MVPGLQSGQDIAGDYTERAKIHFLQSGPDPFVVCGVVFHSYDELRRTFERFGAEYAKKSFLTKGFEEDKKVETTLREILEDLPYCELRNSFSANPKGKTNITAVFCVAGKSILFSFKQLCQRSTYANSEYV